MADLEGVEGISASTHQREGELEEGVACWTWYIQNQDMACISACFLLVHSGPNAV